MTPRVRQYLEQEASSAGVTVADVLSSSRRRVVVHARRRVAVRLRNDGFRYAQISAWMGITLYTALRYMDGAEAPAGWRA